MTIVIRDQKGHELRSSCAVARTRERNYATEAENAQLSTQPQQPETAPKAAPILEVARATENATATQLRVAEHATGAQLDATVAHICWLLHFKDQESREVHFAPAQTHAQVLGEWYPEAVAAEPVKETG